MAALNARLSEIESRIATGIPHVIVLWSEKPGSFFAGVDLADVAHIADAEDGRKKSAEGQRIFRRLEKLPVPTIAAIDGYCVGGGAELALACDFLVMSDAGHSKIGLPETKLGIIPGFGGTVRLPKRIGIRHGLETIVAGRIMSPGRALELGFVDRVFPSETFRESLDRLVDQIISEEEKPPLVDREVALSSRVLESASPLRKLFFLRARRRARQKTQGLYAAPLKAIDVVERTFGMSVDEAVKVEASALGELIVTPTARQLTRLARLSMRRTSSDLEVEDPARPIKRAAVVGAGAIGAQIAVGLASTRIPVILHDSDKGALDRGLARIHKLSDKAVKRGMVSSGDAKRQANLLEGSSGLGALEGADFVVEAIPEGLIAKQCLLREVEEVLSEEAIFATNISSLSVSEIASVARVPERVLGMHFFKPAHKVPFVEVARGDATSDWALVTTFNLARRMGKAPVVVADSPGFIVNRILGSYLNEAVLLVEQGVPPSVVDATLAAFGMPQGPCQLLDEIGFDVVQRVNAELDRAYDGRLESTEVIASLMEAGRLGKKNLRGFYTYSRKGRATNDPDLEAILDVRRSAVPASEIIDRCLLRAVNEALYLLEEGTVDTATDIDLASVYGFGFPAFTGGLFSWADERGTQAVCDRLDELMQSQGSRFKPNPLLVKAARTQVSFSAI